MILAIFALTTVAAYAVTTQFFKGETHTSNDGKKNSFEFDGSAFFTAFGEVGPDEIISVNPVINSELLWICTCSLEWRCQVTQPAVLTIV